MLLVCSSDSQSVLCLELNGGLSQGGQGPRLIRPQLSHPSLVLSAELGPPSMLKKWRLSCSPSSAGSDLPTWKAMMPATGIYLSLPWRLLTQQTGTNPSEHGLVKYKVIFTKCALLPSWRKSNVMMLHYQGKSIIFGIIPGSKHTNSINPLVAGSWYSSFY